MTAAIDKTVNHEAERAVIAALVRNPDGKEIIRLGITPDLFTGEATREAYEAICAEILDGIKPDLATLGNALSPAAKIEFETSLTEHASAANMRHWVARLKACQREREINAARERLAKALAAGCTPNELRPILDSIEQAQAGVADHANRLRVCNTAQLRDAELSSPRFLIEPFIPRDQVTLFGGHGGGGKTSVGYVLCAHVATGTDWAGLRVLPGKVLVVSFEDPEELMLWRFKNIATEYGLDIDAIIRNVRMIDATEAQPIMREVSERGIKSVQPTQDGSDLVAMITGERFDLVQIDNASDCFDGDENNRRQVRQFVRYLAGAIRVHHGALLLLAHIDKTAARYGSAGNSYSGSTAWHNSVRSRLALVDSELRQEKLNVGKRMDAAIKLQFSARGVPVPDSMSDIDETRERDDDAALLACFIAAEEAGATVPTGERGSNTTWHALKVYPEFAPQFRENKDRFQAGVARLTRAGAIIRETYRDHRRHVCERFVLSARVCASFKTSAEVAQPPHDPIPPMRDFRIGGMGELARAQDEQALGIQKLAQPSDPHANNHPDSPLARRILAALSGCPGGLERADLLRMVGNGKGSSPAMIDAEVNRLLLARKIATVNGRLVLEGQP